MKKMNSTLKSEKGIATFEAVALMSIFILFLSYGVGMFGIIHSGILNSIAARTYAWETFSHRTNLTFFRDNRPNPETLKQNYSALSASHYGFRAHGISSELPSASFEWKATTRLLAFTGAQPNLENETNVHNTGLSVLDYRREKIGVNPVWIKTVYGICLNSACGGVRQ